MGKHILVISQYFYPEEFRINDICEEWVKRGYEVTVVTGIPNYPQGKFFDGYGWRKKRKEIYKGIHIIRLPIIPRGERAVTLILNYFSFVVSGFFWKCFTRTKVDKVFIFEVSPMTQALVGVWYAKRRNIPCCIYVQDLWPESVELVTGLHNKQMIHAIDSMVNYIYRNCTKILATSPSFVRRLEERDSTWKGKDSKVVYWPQYAEDFYRPVSRKALSDMPKDDIFKVIFTGNIGYAQGLDILPQIAVLLKKARTECRFIIIGDGRYREEFEEEIARNDVGEMFFLLGRKKPEEVPYYLAWCDVAFISFGDTLTIPAKLQSYMACGMPIVASASGEIQRIVESAKCGMCCPWGDEKALFEAIQSLISSKQDLSMMCNNAKEYYEQHFSRHKLMDEVEKWI